MALDLMFVIASEQHYGDLHVSVSRLFSPLPACTCVVKLTSCLIRTRSGSIAIF